MRILRYLVVVLAATVGCQTEVNSPMTKRPNVQPLFAVGSADQRLVDSFLSRYPVAEAKRFRDILANGPSRLASTNPQTQAQIDAIYAALDRERGESNDGGGFVEVYRPGPEEAALIAQFLQTVPPHLVSKYRRALYASNAEVRSADPEVRRLLAAIYKEREEKQNGGQQ